MSLALRTGAAAGCPHAGSAGVELPPWLTNQCGVPPALLLIIAGGRELAGVGVPCAQSHASPAGCSPRITHWCHSGHQGVCGWALPMDADWWHCHPEESLDQGTALCPL